MSSSAVLTVSSGSSAVKGLPSRCTNRWRAPARSTSKSVSSATTSGRAVMMSSFPRLRRRPISRHRRRLPVTRVPAVWTDAVQRPAGEPAALVDPAAQWADSGGVGRSRCPRSTHNTRMRHRRTPSARRAGQADAGARLTADRAVPALPRELVQPGIWLRSVAEAPVGSARSAAVLDGSRSQVLCVPGRTLVDVLYVSLR